MLELSSVTVLSFHAENHFCFPLCEYDAVVQVSLFLAIVCSVVMGVSHREGEFVLGMIMIVLRTSFERGGRVLSIAEEDILLQVPTTVPTLLNRINLDAHVTTYAVCPQCHCTYPPEYKGGSSVAYPSLCTAKTDRSSEECGGRLTRPAQSESGDDSAPEKTFLYHDFKDYLAGLLSRKDLEELMDKACDDASKKQPGEKLDGVFDGDFLASFQLNDGSRFVDRKGTDGHYAFSLNVDFFNMEGMRVRGAKASCGIISMACLNLPVEIRYKPENMYLAGIVPGPNEPHLTETNHYIRPLIDDLVVGYDPGIRMSRTGLHPQGRLAKCAVILAVCDLPGGRKLAQLAGHSSNFFCSMCNFAGLDHLCNTDFDQWARNPRNVSILRQQAEAWRDAEDKNQQDAIFREHGVRWSELWRLPYWDPTRQLVVDSMHCLLEGLAQQHFRTTLKLTFDDANAKPIPSKAFGQMFGLPFVGENVYSAWPWLVPFTIVPELVRTLTIKDVQAIQGIFDSLTDSLDPNDGAETLMGRLQKKSKPVLWYVLCDIRRPSTGSVLSTGKNYSQYTRAELAASIVDWVSLSFAVTLLPYLPFSPAPSKANG